jgi:hypothetical protein
MDTQAASPGRWGLLVGGAEVATAAVTTWAAVPLAHAGLMPAAVARSSSAHALPPEPRHARLPAAPPSTSAALLTGRMAGEELETVEQSLADGRPDQAVERLAVLLRLDPALAPVNLGLADRAVDAIGDGPGLSAVHLIRGDALRHLGRESDAGIAYQQAHQALAGGPVLKEVT